MLQMISEKLTALWQSYCRMALKELIAVAAAAETVTLLPNMKNYSEI